MQFCGTGWGPPTISTYANTFNTGFISNEFCCCHCTNSISITPGITKRAKCKLISQMGVNPIRFRIDSAIDRKRKELCLLFFNTTYIFMVQATTAYCRKNKYVWNSLIHQLLITPPHKYLNFLAIDNFFGQSGDAWYYGISQCN